MNILPHITLLETICCSCSSLSHDVTRRSNLLRDVDNIIEQAANHILQDLERKDQRVEMKTCWGLTVCQQFSIWRVKVFTRSYSEQELSLTLRYEEGFPSSICWLNHGICLEMFEPSTHLAQVESSAASPNTSNPARYLASTPTR